MNRLPRLSCSLLCGTFLLATFAPAQQQQQQRNKANRSTADDLHDFKRAIALQASPDQTSQFHELTKATAAAQKSAHDLLQLASGPSKSDLSPSVEALSGAVEDALANNDRFVKMFGPAQKSLLKDQVKKLDKANSEVTKQAKALQSLGHSNSETQQLTPVVEKLNKALDDLASNQSAIGTQMAIEPEQPSATAQ
jgi:hypothetical protein